MEVEEYEARVALIFQEASEFSSLISDFGTCRSAIERAPLQAANREMASREAEMSSIAATVKSSMQRELARQMENLTQDHAVDRAELQRTIDHLRSQTQKQSERTDKLLAAANAHDEQLAEAVRMQRHESRITEEQLREEVTRALAERERDRQRHREDAMKMQIDLEKAFALQHRAAAFCNQLSLDLLDQSQGEQRQLLTAWEAECRQAAQEQFDTIRQTKNAAATEFTRRNKVLSDIYTILTEEEPGSLPITTKALVAAARALRDREDCALASLNQIEAQRSQVLAEVEEKFQEQERRMEDLHQQSLEALNACRSRCNTSDENLDRVRERVRSTLSSRVATRSADLTLEMIIKEHDEEVATLKQQLLLAEETARSARRSNKQDVFEALEREHLSLVAEHRSVTDDLRHWKAAASAAQAERTSSEQSSASLLVANRTLRRELEELNAKLTDEHALRDEALIPVRQRISELESSVRRLEADREQSTERMEMLESELAEVQSYCEKLKEKLIEAEASAQAAELSRRKIVIKEVQKLKEGQTEEINVAAAASAIEQLENKVHLLQRERLQLRRQLDSTLAEVSAAEERRNHTMKKYLDLMSSNDAAPRREQGLRHREKDIEDKEGVLRLREMELDRRAVDLSKKEIAFSNRAAVSHLSSQASPVHKTGSAYGGAYDSTLRGMTRSDAVSTTSTSTSSYSYVPEKTVQNVSPLAFKQPIKMKTSESQHPQRL